MKIYNQSFTIQTVCGRPSYHDIREEIKTIVKQSNVQNGILVIQPFIQRARFIMMRQCMMKTILEMNIFK